MLSTLLSLFLAFSSQADEGHQPSQSVRDELAILQGLDIPPVVQFERHGDLEIVHIQITILFDQYAGITDDTRDYVTDLFADQTRRRTKIVNKDGAGSSGISVGC